MSTTQATNKVTSQQHVNAIKFVNGIRHALDAFQYDSNTSNEHACEQTSQALNDYLDSLSTKRCEHMLELLTTMNDVLTMLFDNITEDTTEDIPEDIPEDTTEDTTT